MKLPGLDQLAHHAPLRPERRDERTDHDHAGIHEELRHLPDTPDVLDAIGVGEAQVAVQAVAHVVAVEHVRVRAPGVELPLDDVGDRALARAGQAP